MGTASGIRAGAAYVEITADDTPMQQRLAASQARLRQWAAENSGGVTISKATEGAIPQGGGPGFFGGTFRGMNLLGEQGLRFAVGVQAARVAIRDVEIFSRMAAGDFEEMRKAAEELPFGLGEVVKMLSGPVDSAMNSLVARLTGTWQMKGVYAGTVSEADRHKTVDQYNHAQKAIAELDEAYAKATMSARDFAKAQVEGMGLLPDDAKEVLARKLRNIEADEQKKADAQRQARAKDETDAVARARMELAKATMSEDDFLEMQVRLLGYSADKTAELLAYRKELLRVKREEAAEETRIAVAQAVAQVENDLVTEELQRLQKQMDDTRREAESLTERMMTPEERAGAEIEHYKELLSGGDITGETYQRAVRKALEDAAAAIPDVAARATIGVRGTFSAIEAASALGAGGVQDRIAEATATTAKNTARIAELAAKFGVTYTD